MKLIFCISNLFIPASISYIKEYENEVFILYTDQKGIAEFFNKIELKNVIIYFRKELYFKKTNFLKFFLERRKLLSELIGYDVTEILFFHNSFGGIENWIIRKMSSKCQISHFPIFNELSFPSKYTIKSTISTIKSYITNSIWMIPLWTGERYIHKLPESFFRNTNAQRIDIKVNESFISNLLNTKLKFSNKNIIFLTGTVVELNQVREYEYTSKIDELLLRIGKYNIIAKPHPRYPNLYSQEKELDVIPSFIPANVLFSKFKVFIGYSSTVLAEAANKGNIAISLLDYIEPISIERKIQYKKYLTKNSLNKNLIFPTRLEEIVNIVQDYT